jgi:hypothetical protein
MEPMLYPYYLALGAAKRCATFGWKTRVVGRLGGELSEYYHYRGFGK